MSARSGTLQYHLQFHACSVEVWWEQLVCEVVDEQQTAGAAKEAPGVQTKPLGQAEPAAQTWGWPVAGLM